MMGVHVNVDYDKYPRQNDRLGVRVNVRFKYNTQRQLSGTLVRDDFEEPYVTLIILDDGRIIRAEECQWSYV